MAVQSITDAYQHLAQAETKSDRERKADFLRMLSVGTIVLLGLALLIVLSRNATGKWISLMVVVLAITAHVTIWYLNKKAHTDVAAQLFCYLFDAELFVLFWLNLRFVNEEDKTALVAVLMGMAMTLSVLLAGMLISRRMSLYFAAGNTLLIIIPYLLYSPTISDALHTAFPIIGFTWMMALISWLYQRSLSNAHARLNAARQEVMRSELLRRDLTIARELQQRLYPAPPTNSGALTFATLCEPARETSGDFYDFIALEPGVWAIVVADVTGKSLAAAMVMTMTRSIIRSNSQRSLNAAEVIAHTNEILCEDSAVKQLTTAFYGILDTRRMTLRFANAGHPYPMLKRNGRVEDLELAGFPLGSWLTATYSERTVQLQPGDQLVLVSDGIVEAMNGQRELFGFERLAETIARAECATPQSCVDAIWQAVERFQAGAEQQDDKTIVVIHVAAEAVVPAPAPQAVGAFA